MAMIEFNDVSFEYPNGFLAVENVSFKIEKGQSIAIVGQNGAGKTTTVKMMNGLLKPTSGTVIIDGMNTRDHTTAQVSRHAGYVFQNPDDQIFHNTVGDEIRFGPKTLGYAPEKVEELVQFAAGLVGIQDGLDKNPYDYPLSIRKFVTIASVLAMDTDIIILDEPTAGQDLKGIRILENMLKVLKEKGKTVITITHDMEYVIDNFETVFVMAHKNLLKTGSGREVFRDGALLEESMLKRPYVSGIAEELKLEEGLISQEELVDYISRQLQK